MVTDKTKESKKDEWVTSTSRIRLYIDTPKGNTDELNQAFRKLHDWQAIAYKVSNQIASHLYLQDQVKEFLYFTENTKVKLADYEKDNNGILNTSRENSTYRVISNKFKNELPSSIATCLNHNVYSNYIKERPQYFSGTRSLRSYKSNLPVPIRSMSIYDLRYDNEIKNFRFLLFKDKKYSIPFKTYLGRDFSGNKLTLERCLSSEYKLCNSSYTIEDGEIFLNLCVLQPIIANQVDPNITAQAMLSFLVPIIVTLNEKQYYIGDKDSYLYKREAIQKGLNRRQKSMKFNKGGKGRARKLKGTEVFKRIEKHSMAYYTHKISHELIKFCIDHNVGKLVLKDIIQIAEEAKDNPFILRNWSYGQLKYKIAYKCKKNNIQLVLD